MRPNRRPGARKDLASDARHRKPRSRPPPDRLRAPPEGSRPHQREGSGRYQDFGRSPEQAVSRVPDTIRYTFQYREARYTQGVWADIGRLKEQGFRCTVYGMRGRRISTRESTASGSIRTAASGSKYSSTPASASRPSSSRIRLRTASHPSSPISSSRWCWKHFRRKSPPMCRFHPVLSTFPTTLREAQMPDKVTYYAVVDDLSSRERASRGFSAHLHRGWRPVR